VSVIPWMMLATGVLKLETVWRTGYPGPESDGYPVPKIPESRSTTLDSITATPFCAALLGRHMTSFSVPKTTWLGSSANTEDASTLARRSGHSTEAAGHVQGGNDNPQAAGHSPPENRRRPQTTAGDCKDHRRRRVTAENCKSTKEF